MSKKLEALSIDERIDLAKETVKKLTDNVLEVLALHETNKIIFYSSVLNSQIPVSKAGNAYNLFQNTLFRHELLRLCVMWDKYSLNRHSIPTVVSLINNNEVLEKLFEQTQNQWPREYSHGQEFATNNRKRLKEILHESDVIRTSKEFKELENFRDKHLAHSLTKSWAEEKSKIENPKTGYEERLLKKTINIVEELHVCVNNTGLDIDQDCRQIFRDEAEQLWLNCEFNIPM